MQGKGSLSLPCWPLCDRPRSALQLRTTCIVQPHRRTVEQGSDNPVAFDAPLDLTVACTSLVRFNVSPTGFETRDWRIGSRKLPTRRCRRRLLGRFGRTPVTAALLAHNPPFALAVDRGVSGCCAQFGGKG
ncbi:hypothetical protein IG631_22001 [Alternaria alternata]|nr:hypothetical protein IG631_22001 [Alternaria alternata]